MKILLLNWRDLTHPRAGGAELVTMEHAKGWVRAGHRVTWVTGWYGGKKEETIEGVYIVRRAGSLTIYLYAMVYILINSHFFDVIVDEAHGFPFFTPLFTKKPVVLFIHEIAGEIWDYMFSFPKNIIGKFLESSYFRLYKHCHVWTDAPSTIDELVERGIPRDHCIAIPCPIVSKSPLKGMLKKEKNPTYIFVSRVVRMKGVEEVIKAFSFIYREDQKSKLWIVGGGEDSYVRELKTMTEEYGIGKNVQWFGVVSEQKKYELMTKAHLLLHASVKEGWGLVVLEAVSVGTPAVVYNVGGLKDVVKNGITGIVISDNSPLRMAEAALKLYSDKKMYNLYQSNGKKRVDSLKWKNVTRQSLLLLTKAAKTKTDI
ncbi:MAG: glycosyltransferase family 4 protein [Candidatus Gottesmanbacteria bacterium]